MMCFLFRIGESVRNDYRSRRSVSDYTSAPSSSVSYAYENPLLDQNFQTRNVPSDILENGDNPLITIQDFLGDTFK